MFLTVEHAERENPITEHRLPRALFPLLFGDNDDAYLFVVISF